MVVLDAAGDIENRQTLFISKKREMKFESLYISV
ncbi:MAG: hypothetical protein ACI8X3_000781, partial [Saprospiraceae bacterium]